LFEADVSVEDVWPEGNVQSRELEDIEQTRVAGQEWIESGRSCVLRVPSIVVPEEQNLVVNPLHAEAEQITLTVERPFTFDGRLL
jgi:RES domain-containing protein